MRRIISENRILTIMLIIGLVCSLLLCALRADIEQEHTGVSLIMTESDVALLAEKEGISAQEYGKKLTDAGLSAIFTPGEICRELDLYIGESYSGQDAVVGMPEDDDQYSHDEIEGFAYSDTAEVVRVFRLRPEYAARYASLGYSGPEEIENLTYRTITDRNIRVIWLTPFTTEVGAEPVSDIEAYTSVIEGIGRRIEAHGLHLGQFSVIEPYSPNTAAIFGVIAGLAAAGVLLLHSLFPMGGRLRTALAIVCFMAGCAVNCLSEFVLPLAASIVYPCLGIRLMAELMLRIKPGSKKQLILGYLLICLSGFAVALIGGNAIAALQSDRAWLLAVKNFRGVKLSQIVPLIYALFICLRCFFRDCTLTEIIAQYRSKAVLIMAAAAIMAVGIFYIARTGDGMLDAGITEQRFRNFLENSLIVRPRTKEFLAAWPAVAVAVVFLSRQSRRYALPFAAAGAIGLASVANTFCHSRSPLWLSLARGGMGLLFGAVIGCTIIAIFAKRGSCED